MLTKKIFNVNKKLSTECIFLIEYYYIINSILNYNLVPTTFLDYQQSEKCVAMYFLL